MNKGGFLIVTGRAFNAWRARLPLAKVIKNNGFSVTIAAAGDGYYDKKIECEGVHFIHVPFFRFGISLISEFISIVTLTSFLSKNSVKVCHAFNPKPILIMGLIIRFFPNTKYFVTITGLGDLDGGSFKTSLIKYAYKFSISRAVMVCVENQHDYDFIVRNKMAKAGKCVIAIASGVETNIFPRRNRRDGASPIKFFFASRLLRSKGLCEFLTASSRLKAEYGDMIEIIVAGEIELGHSAAVSLEEIEVLHNVGIINYVGALSANDVCVTLQNVDIAVLPSYREGFSKFLMEGSAAGCALISTDIPGCSEIVINGETGLTVSLKSQESLYVAMNFYLEQPGFIYEHGRNAQLRAKQYFDNSITTEKNYSVYSSVNQNNIL